MTRAGGLLLFCVCRCVCWSRTGCRLCACCLRSCVLGWKLGRAYRIGPHSVKLGRTNVREEVRHLGPMVSFTSNSFTCSAGSLASIPHRTLREESLSFNCAKNPDDPFLIGNGTSAALRQQIALHPESFTSSLPVESHRGTVINASESNIESRQPLRFQGPNLCASSSIGG